MHCKTEREMKRTLIVYVALAALLQATQCIYNQQTFSTVCTHTHTSTACTSVTPQRTVVCKCRLPSEDQCASEMVKRGCYCSRNMNYILKSA